MTLSSNEDPFVIIVRFEFDGESLVDATKSSGMFRIHGLTVSLIIYCFLLRFVTFTVQNITGISPEVKEP